MGEGTEAVAATMGPRWGGLLNATFGNAAELIISIAAIRAGLLELVKASITGSILGNILFVLGLSLLLGGWRNGVQRFDRAAAGTNATMVFRAGGRHVWGDGFPADESAFIGGKHSLRGYRHDRFAGRSSAYGAAEIRIPLFEMELMTRGRVGILGFEDVGRVWWDEAEESTRWHNGYGGGIWFESLGFYMSAAMARGEETRLYFDFSSGF